MADLRQNTLAIINYGPFVDATDFKTLLNDLDSSGTNELTQSTIRLSKNGGWTENSNATAITWTANGTYRVTLPLSAVDTRGIIDLSTDLASSLVVEDRYTVLSQAVYDQKYGDKEYATQENLDSFKTAFGTTKVKSIDGSDVDFVSMFTKTLDDNNGDQFDAAADSLNKLRSDLQMNLDSFKTAFGTTKVKSIDGSDVDFVSMFIKTLDDNNGDHFDAATDSLNKFRSDLQIVLDLGGTGATLQGNLKDIYDKAGSGGGGGGIAWTDQVNGETFQSVMNKLSARTTGRIFRVDNGNGTYTVTYYYSNNAEAYSNIVSENERLDA